MSRRLWLRGGRVVDPGNGRDETVDVVVADERVLEVGPAGEPGEDDRVVDLAGAVLVPGFVESQARLGEPGFEHRETLETGLAAAAAGGFTAVACLAATDPPMDDRSTVEMVRGEASRHPSAALLPIAAVSRGRRGEELTEMAELRDAGAVAFSDAPRSQRDPAFLRRALLYARHFDAPIVERPEDADLAGGGVVHEGPVSTRLGLAGIPAVAEEVAVTRALILAGETGGRLHLSPVSTAASLEAIRQARVRGVRVTCSVAIHHVLLEDEDVARSRFSPATRVDPPLRPSSDVEALVRGLCDGTVDVLTSDHAPWHETEKDVPFGDAPAGIAGLETLVPLALDRLVRPGLLSLSRLVELLALGPCKLFGLPSGGLVAGEPADLTVLDLERRVVLGTGGLRSRSRNSPFLGEECVGAVRGTVRAGSWRPVGSSRG